MGPHFGGSPEELPKKILREKIASAARQLYTKIKFPCFVVQEKKSIQNLGRKKGKKKKKKEKKKKKNHIAAKSGLVEMNGYLKIYLTNNNFECLRYDYLLYFNVYVPNLPLLPLFCDLEYLRYSR